MTYLNKSYLVTIAFILSIGGNLYAQQAFKDVAALGNAPAPTKVNDIEDGNASSKMIDMQADYPIIWQHFNKYYPEATHQQWTESGQSLFVEFLNNGSNTRACFTKKGQMNYALLETTAEQLPDRVNLYIKKNYPAYQVFNAVKIDVHDSVSYQVILESDAGYVTIKTINDGVKELSRISKPRKQ